LLVLRTAFIGRSPGYTCRNPTWRTSSLSAKTVGLPARAVKIRV